MGASNPPKPARRKPPRAALAIFSTLFALLVAEAICRAARLAPPLQAIWVNDEKSPYKRSQNPIRRHELKPGFTGTSKAGPLTVNSFGHRGPERSVAKAAGTRRIALLGDSVTEGAHTVADHDAIDRQLEAQYPPGSVEFLNFGVAGYNTLAAVATLREQALQFKPDIVVLIFVVNDFVDFIPEHTLAGGVSKRPKIVKLLFEHSFLFRRASLQFNLFQFQDELDTARWNKDAVGENNVVQGLNLLQELAREYRFVPLIAIWPHFLDDQIADLHFMPASNSTLVIEALAMTRGLPTIRLSDAFREHWRERASDDSPRTLYTANGDGMHPNKLAISIAAEVLRDFIDAPPEPGPAPPNGLRLAAEETARSLGGRGYLDVAPMKSRTFEVLTIQGRTLEAEAYLRSLIDRDPLDFYALLQLGILRHDAGDFNEARALLERARAIQPDAPGINEYLGLTLLHLGRENDALPLLQAAARESAAPPEVTAAIREIQSRRSHPLAIPR